MSKREPVLFWDWTRSMEDEMSDGMGGIPENETPRYQVLTPAVEILATRFYEMDSAADEKQEIDPETGKPGGGALTYIISGEHANALGDLNQHNWQRKTAGLRPHGGTYIMPQIRQWESDRQAEFAEEDSGNAEEVTVKCLVVATDGALDETPDRRTGKSDHQQFVEWLNSPRGGAADDIEVSIVLVGNGSDTRAAYGSYKTLEAQHPGKVKLVPAMGHTSTEIANEVLALFA